MKRTESAEELPREMAEERAGGTAGARVEGNHALQNAKRWPVCVRDDGEAGCRENPVSRDKGFCRLPSAGGSGPADAVCPQQSSRFPQCTGETRQRACACRAHTAPDR